MCSYSFDRVPKFSRGRQPQQIFIGQIFISGTKALLQPRCFLFAKFETLVSKRCVKNSQTFQESSQVSFIIGTTEKNKVQELGLEAPIVNPLVTSSSQTECSSVSK